MKFGVTVWATLILVILVSLVEGYDQRLAMALVVVTLFALFMAHADQIQAIFAAITPRSGG